MWAKMGLWMAGSLVLLIQAPLLRSAETPKDQDEALLEASGVGTDPSKVLAYLRRLSGSDDDLLRVDLLVRQLGHDDFAKREQASEKLLRLGLAALPALDRARGDVDKEVVRRARACMAAIAKAHRVNTPLAGVRFLVQRHLAGSLEACLRYLPYTTDELVEEELYYGIETLAVTKGVIHNTLLAALKDKCAARRAVAACIVGRWGTAKERAAVRSLLADRDSTVRLRCAQGLLAGKDPAGIPILINLLEDPSIAIAWQAEELLHYLAGKGAPRETIGNGTERRRYCAAWKKWWKSAGGRADLRAGHERYSRPSLALACGDGGVKPDQGKVWLCGGDGQVRWELNTKHEITDVQLLRSNKILLAHSEKPADDDEPSGRIIEQTLGGKVLWERPIWRGQAAPYCRRLANGDTFVFTGAEWEMLDRRGREFGPERNTVDGLRVGNTYLTSAVRLPNGHVIGTWWLESKGRLAEFADSSERVLGTIQIKGVRRMSGGKLEVTSRGNYIIVLGGKVIMIVKPTGDLIWKKEVTNVRRCSGRRNGNLLACVWDWKRHLLEMTPDGKVLWKRATDFLPERIYPCLPLVEFGFHSSN